jgi:hypothetical protein
LYGAHALADNKASKAARELGVTHALRVDANGEIEVSRDFMPRL